MTGAELIAAERERQEAQEGWSSDHDDEHDSGQLALAAAVYALPQEIRDRDTYPELIRRHDGPNGRLRTILWPWPGWFKPTPDDRVRELVKAGALIAAEIDRLQRATS